MAAWSRQGDELSRDLGSPAAQFASLTGVRSTTGAGQFMMPWRFWDDPGRMAALHKLQRKRWPGMAGRNLTRTPPMGALVIFDAPGRSWAASPEEEDARTHVGSSGIPQP
jgi:hypothetical protein